MSYPLKPIEVEGNKTGVPEAQWRKWLLSMHTLLFTEDASLLDAILLWKNSMDKLFDGIESCLICYSVFHQNGLPRLGCKTCHNKFHSACLYKWFNSSHKSNCPLVIFNLFFLVISLVFLTVLLFILKSVKLLGKPNKFFTFFFTINFIMK